jgi:hypothetical protein
MRNPNLETRQPDRLIHRPFIRDPYFLIAPYAKERIEGFDILEKSIRTFYDDAILRGSILKGMLLHSNNEE